MSKIFKNSSDKLYMNGDHKKYLSRITKTLYYGKLPKTDCLSWPVTEFAADIFSETKKGKSLDRLHCYKAAEISRNACVAPCSLVLALLYLDRLKTCNPQYLEKICPSDLFLVSLMVSCKFLFDDGEGDEVFLDEWAASGGLNIKDLIRLEKEFLSAINWEIFVSDKKFNSKLQELEFILAIKQGRSRGNFTYTELNILSSTIEIQNIIHCITAITVILALTYLAGVLTIVGSVFLTSKVPGTSLHVKKIEKLETVTQLTWKPDYTLKTDVDNIKINKTHARIQTVVDMLKTSILLASINTNTTTYEDTTSDIQNVTWDYWNNPVMDWLAKSSQIVTSFTTDMQSNYLPYYLETTVHNMKQIELEDQIHKATKTRIQDQLESSWHVEWIESLKLGIYTKSVRLG
ncbi:unnamed protein product [Psylliodes chrysocephalus]|uniref:Protein CNPPD1 n=1 Tax=Psylliodes chrysocephalus TaxID=3402493 RepID=A0A9P0CTX4_9CUCU|nr:unnamed protein product [Psylliodes chrysocephala]